MDAGDWIALGAAAGGAAIGLVGLYLGGRHRRADIAIDEARMVRARVWELMKSEPGLRTVLALDERDGKAARRVNYLQRTATQLDAAGVPELGDRLRDVLRRRWGTDTDDSSRLTRDRFLAAVTKFMKPQ